MITGVKPKETMSQTVSICTPNVFSSRVRLHARAILPSNTSQKQAQRNKTTADLKLWESAENPAPAENSKPARVTMLAGL